MTHYAVNIGDLADLKRTDPTLVDLMIVPAAPGHYDIDAEPKNIDGAALLVDEERAQAVCDIIRGKYPKHVMRCYESKNLKTWKRI